MSGEKRTGRFATVQAALDYVERHYIPLGIWTGARAHADGSASLLYDPDEGTSGPRDAPKGEKQP